MKKSLFFSGILFFGLAMLMAPSFTNHVTVSADSAKTAQSVWIQINGGGNFIVSGNQVWHFNQECGGAYFSASGGNSNNWDNAKKNEAQQQRCNFWDGDVLSGGTQGQTTLTPLSSDPVAAKTCWDLQKDSGGDGTATVCLDIILAGESFVLNNTFKPLGKYSFTLQNADLTSRVQNLKVEITGDYNQVNYPAHTIEVGDPYANNCLLDFAYNCSNVVATNGSATSSLKCDKTMGQILNSDSFAPNNAGCAYTAIARVEQICYTLGPGSYTVTVTGTVKGNDGTATLSFAGHGNFSISAEGCEHP